MDNPWASPWADPDETSSALKPASEEPSWHPRAVSPIPDFTAPSWGPSESMYEAPSVWGAPADTWDLHKAGSTTIEAELTSTPSRSPSPDAASEPESVPSTERSNLESRPATPAAHSDTDADAFGTFTTAFEASESADPWSTNEVAYVQDNIQNAWESAPSKDIPKDVSASDHDSAEADEWELARRNKETMDQTVPPELLASILRQCEELSAEIWPDISKEDDREDAVYHPTIENIPGLSDNLDRICPPDQVLPQQTSFVNSHLAKRMSEAIKLTRHTGITQTSPMAKYLASKGSTAWEAGVKSSIPSHHEEALVPKGWKAVSESGGVTKVILTEDEKPKKAGILSSFFTRKSESNEHPHSPPVIAKPSEAEAASTVATIPTPASAVHPRASLIAPVIPPTAIASTSTSQPPLIQSSSDEDLPLVTAPSAVSRFLTRFSRTTTPSMRLHARAISEDDTGFLDDLVPSLMDDDDGLDALANMIASPAPPPIKDLTPSSLLHGNRKVGGSKGVGAAAPLDQFDPMAQSRESTSSISRNVTLSLPRRSNTPTILPPPTSRGTPPPLIPPPQRRESSRTTATTLFDDDFEDFETFTPTMPQSRQSGEGGSLTTSSTHASDRPLIEAVANASVPSTSNDFDDFDDFVSQPISSPSPPPLPAKSPRYNPTRQGATPSKIGPPPSRSSGAPLSHSRDLLSLSSVTSELDLSEGSAAPLRIMSPPLKPAAPLRAISPPMQPGVPLRAISPPMQPAAPLRAISPPIQPASSSFTLPTQPPKAPAQAQGGLSAQDLSFFEGF